MGKKLIPIVLLLMVQAGCKGDAKPQVTSDPATPQPTKPVPEPVREKGPTCDELGESFRTALTAATGKCETDEQCAVYPILFDCGGIIDKASADKMRALRQIWREKECGMGVQCAARIRQIPICVDGECEGKPVR